eukprot:scaffold67729_cov70-Phaeocystis_antarctica.AAC.1
MAAGRCTTSLRPGVGWKKPPSPPPPFENHLPPAPRRQARFLCLRKSVLLLMYCASVSVTSCAGISKTSAAASFGPSPTSIGFPSKVQSVNSSMASSRGCRARLALRMAHDSG